MVFDIGDLYVKGREWKVGREGLRAYLRDRKGSETERGRKGGEEKRKGGEQPALTIKNCSRALGQ